LQVHFYLIIAVSEYLHRRDDIRKEIRDLKRELQGDKKKKEEQEEEAQRNIEVAKNETIEAYKQEQEKYKQLKSQIPKEGKSKLHGVAMKFAE
jgi:Skp family chaperone for outer membrane proteins